MEMRKMAYKSTLFRTAVAVAMAFLIISCDTEGLQIPEYPYHDAPLPTPGPSQQGGYTPSTGRVPGKESRNVFLLYAAGHNNLYRALASDIEELTSGWLPNDSKTENTLLIYAHLAYRGNYSKPTSPVLMRVSSGPKGTDKKVIDTLVVYPEGTVSSSAEQINTVLTYVKENFPAKSYGMGFSSHSTGYLPNGYTSSHSNNDYIIMSFRQGEHQEINHLERPVPYYEADIPLSKTIGHDDIGNENYEMDLRDFARAIPMQLDYLIFDTCLMGGIEVAYELKDKCRFICFSQAEIDVEGFDYRNMTVHLLQGKEPDPLSVCQDYYRFYSEKPYGSATISMIDCRELPALAEVCREIFTSNREGMAKIEPHRVQKYFNYGWHWFYDLEDIIVQAGASEQEQASLRTALEDCVVYKANTPHCHIDSGFPIRTHSGFSMYLPCHGDEEMDIYYRTLEWNKASGLVQ